MRFTVYYSILLSLIIIECSSNSEDVSSSNISLPDSVLFASDEIFALELSFGSEVSNLPDEFLLARPNNICVSNNGDILVSDEKSIKVYDSSGKPKKIIGRTGQGPGEFSRDPLIFMGPEGYIMANEFFMSGVRSYYTLISPDYKFIYKKRLDNNSLLKTYLDSIGVKFQNVVSIGRIYPINELETVYEIWSSEQDNQVIRLFHEKAGSLTLLAVSKIRQGIPGSYSNIYGSFYSNIIDSKRVIYINDMETVFDEKNGSFYTLHIVNLDTYEDNKFNRKFIPKKIDVSEHVNGFERRSNKRSDEIKDLETKKLKEQKYYYPTVLIHSDKNYVYVGLVDNFKEYFDIFDINAEIFLSTLDVYVTVPPSVIKDGYVYGPGDDKYGFPIINKHKINPKVFGK